MGEGIKMGSAGSKIKNSVSRKMRSLTESLTPSLFVEKVSPSIVGRAQTGLNSRFYSHSSSIAPLTDTKVVWFTQPSETSGGVYATVVDVDASDLTTPKATSGSSVLLASSGAINTDIVGVKLSGSTVFVAIGKHGYQMYCHLLTINGSEITVTKTLRVTTALNYSAGITVTILSSNRLMVTCEDTMQGKLQCMLFSYNASDIADLGSHLSSLPYSPNSSGVPTVRARKIGSNQVALLATHNYSTPNLHIVLATFDGDQTLTFGTALLVSPKSSFSSNDLLAIDDDTVFVNHRYDDDTVSEKYAKYSILKIDSSRTTFTVHKTETVYNGDKKLWIYAPWVVVDYHDGVITTLAPDNSSIDAVRFYYNSDLQDISAIDIYKGLGTQATNSAPDRTFPHTIISANRVIITYACSSNGDSGVSVISFVNAEERVQKSISKIDGVTVGACKPDKLGTVSMLQV